MTALSLSVVFPRLMQEFQLRVVPTDNNNFALELYQCAYKEAGEKRRPAAKRIGRLKGQALVQARQAIYECLKANNSTGVGSGVWCPRKTSKVASEKEN